MTAMTTSNSNNIDDDAEWERYFEKLLSFKKKNGHTKVPKHFSEDLELATWVGDQRKDYKLYVALKSDKERLNLFSRESVKLSPEKAKRLESIGFETSNKNPRHLRWDFRFQQLKKFLAEFGHTQVPIGWEENPKLSNWVSTQRQEYKNIQNGKTSQLTENRIQLLNEIGFAWEVQRGGRRRRLKSGSKSPNAADREAEDIVPGKTLLGGGASVANSPSEQKVSLTTDQGVALPRQPWQEHEEKLAVFAQRTASLGLREPHALGIHHLDQQQAVLRRHQEQLYRQRLHQEQLHMEKEAMLVERQAMLASSLRNPWERSARHAYAFPALPLSHEADVWNQPSELSSHLFPGLTTPYHQELRQPPTPFVGQSSALEMMMLARSSSSSGRFLPGSMIDTVPKPTADPLVSATASTGNNFSVATSFQPQTRRQKRSIDPPESDDASKRIETSRDDEKLTKYARTEGKNKRGSRPSPLKTSTKKRKLEPKSSSSVEKKTSLNALLIATNPAKKPSTDPMVIRSKVGDSKRIVTATEEGYSSHGSSETEISHTIGVPAALSLSRLLASKAAAGGRGGGVGDKYSLKPTKPTKRSSSLKHLNGSHFDDAENDHTI